MKKPLSRLEMGFFSFSIRFASESAVPLVVNLNF